MTCPRALVDCSAQATTRGLFDQTGQPSGCDFMMTLTSCSIPVACYSMLHCSASILCLCENEQTIRKGLSTRLCGSVCLPVHSRNQQESAIQYWSRLRSSERPWQTAQSLYVFMFFVFCFSVFFIYPGTFYFYIYIFFLK